MKSCLVRRNCWKSWFVSTLRYPAGISIVEGQGARLDHAGNDLARLARNPQLQLDRPDQILLGTVIATALRPDQFLVGKRNDAREHEPRQEPTHAVPHRPEEPRVV